MPNLKQILLFLVVVVFSFETTAQRQNPWQIENKQTPESLSKVNRSSTPRTYKIFSLDLQEFKQQLTGAPVRGHFSGRSNHEILLPNAEGVVERYHVMETPIMEKELADKFPMIKSYAAQGVDDPTAVARFSVTQFGLHSMTFSSKTSTTFIDPYTENQVFYIVYKKSDLVANESNFECLTDEGISLPSTELDRNAFEHDIFNTDDNTLRTYRLAQSCTAEYGNIFAGTGTLAQQKANIQAQMAITMTRVNGVYEIDLGITMIFVANNDAVIYLGATNSDPWGNEWNTTTAQTLDSVIGVNNYDIGHNFNTTGGGNAGCIGCVCRAVSQSGTHKGRGYTGRANPTGDAFDIDYVAHEMGHQFGGYHTQSNSSCRSGSGQTEVEPGSASTIMGYAGICSANVQSNSDAYFAYVNIRDIMAYVKSANGSCSVNTPIANQTPVVTAGLDYTIPRSTAFVLTAEASDPDDDTLLYTWEQRDPENPSSNAAPTATRAVGPMFRSITGTTSPERYFPAMATILTGATSNTWEVVPSVSRTMNFSVVVRDNVAGNGQTNSDLMLVTVNAAAGPFLVSSPNTNVSWLAGSNQNITWDVAGTTANGVNSPYVDIFLSTNGGNSFPVLLASKVPNDGAETVTIPNTTGNQNRIMVRGHNHIFLDVSNTNFTVSTTTPTFALAFNGQADGQNKAVCQGQSAVFDIDYSTIGGFSGTTTLSVSGNPAGTSVSFSQPTISSTGTVQLSLTDTDTAIPGIYQMIITGTSGSITKTVNLYVEVLNSAFQVVSPVNPLDLATGVSNNSVTIEWVADPSATNYDFELASDVDFTTVLVSQNVTTNQYTATNLDQNTNYFWRVLPKNNGCQGEMSAVFRFTTGSGISCDPIVNSTNVPLAISASGTPTINSTLSIPTNQNQSIDKITVSLNITHTWMADLTVTLISPLGTQVQLFSGQCNNRDNAVATFDDEGITLTCQTTTPTITGTLIPAQPLSTLIGENSEGTWTLRIFDAFNQDGGTLNSWGITICTTDDTPLSCGDITSVWNGTTWSNGYPVNNVAAVINDDFVISNNLECCSFTINNSAQVVVESGNNLIVENEVTIAGTASFTLENNANLIQINDVANSGIINQFRNSNSLMRLDYAMWSSPVTGSQSLKDFSPLTLNNRFYTYNSTNNIYSSVSNPLNTIFNEGVGYLIRMPDNHPTSPTIWTGEFIGVPKNGDIAVDLSYISNSQKYNAIGNPYPSTISAEAFLLSNVADIEGTIYFWRKTNNASGTAYATYTLGGATSTSPTSPVPNGTIQVGQGFIVAAQNVVNPTARFSNDLRVDNNSNQIFRSNFGLPYAVQTEMERHRIWLNLTNDAGFFSQMMVGYLSDATNDVDQLIDGKYIGDSDTALSSSLNNEEYVIQGKALPFEVSDVVPLVFKTNTPGNFAISLAAVDGLFEGDQPIYLRDNLAGIVHELTDTNYVFNTESGVFKERFEIVFEDVTLGVDNPQLSNSLVIATGNQQIELQSISELIQKIQIFDVLGRRLYQLDAIQNQSFVVPGLLPQNQALFVKVEMNNGQTITKKIIF
ncbi:T9SS sorting signal type C domain-containing protein [Flavobacterium piscinae]|uniref:T9SS sorting signal type C domain-containing protein n=1 Tax=Flavobacterium piscinae TaxID=2506424 RepID=A0A4Q1KZW7_9FLAO|nr:zinc-dependent metalloprotease family protein [Flavobacterium piscinae]RXR35340.1 T9SS sorting signal type C domain-containing protein [Flavobacterium piscinae]